MLTAQNILEITPADAVKLFPGELRDIKSSYKKLAQIWHPDHNPNPEATAVFAHISKLRDIAVRLQKGGRISPALVVREYDLGTGKTSIFRYVRAHKGDLGDILISAQSIVYEIPIDFADVACAERDRIANFRYADDAMKNEISRYLPVLKRALELSDRQVLFYEKPQDCVLLTDLAAYFDHKMPAVHVAWIVSSLMNMACYLGWSELVHGAIAMDTVLVCPAKHSISLVGGWGYATAVGRRPNVLPRRTTSLVPRLTIKGETISPRVDIDLIKDIAQELLGAPGGAGLHFNKDVPLSIKEWLVSPSSDDAVAEYRAWMKALVDGFGKRRFVEMKVSPDVIYATPN